MSRAEMDALGWDSCDVILVTGDAYIDHPSFGMALVGRLLEAQGFRVGIISQPDWRSAEAFRALGRPNLYFGVTAGNMDSMVNRYTSDRKIRSDDAYTAGAEAHKRPDRAVTAYAQRCREAFKEVPVIVGGIEASLRRIAHYDYWSDKVRRSVLADSKADMLLYGNAERALVALTHRLASGEKITDIRDLRGTAFMVPRDWLPSEEWIELDSTLIDTPGRVDSHPDPYAESPSPGAPRHPLPLTGEGSIPPSPASGRGAGGEGKQPTPAKPLPTDILAHARELRSHQTDAEHLLWEVLRAKRFLGLKFRRQHPIGRYILDFYCDELKLAIELDGGQHAEQQTYDAERTRYLEQQGIHVLRYSNNDVLAQTEAVLEAIYQEINSVSPTLSAPQLSLSPNLSPACGREEPQDTPLPQAGYRKVGASSEGLGERAKHSIPLRFVSREQRLAARREARAHTAVRLPAYEQVEKNNVLYAHASRVFHLESNPGNARAMVQAHGERDVWLNPPPIPLSTEEMDRVYDLSYARAPHPSYKDARIPAWEMIRFSVNIMRGCFGGCTFCSITEHEGRIIQSRSEQSILAEIEAIRDKTPGFTGIVSDLGGPTANMYRLKCKDETIESACRRLSCVFPDICHNMSTDHGPLIQLYRKARALPGIKKVLIGSGVRYDLAVKSPEYVKELVQHHVGGYLKIAPEHTEAGPLNHMMKPGIGSYEKFKQLFEKYSKEAGKEQYLIPYFIAAHPGTTDEDMLKLAIWLKRNGFRLDQVQTFLPTPMAMATTMWHTELNPLKKVLGGRARAVPVTRLGRTRKLHKAFLRYHDPENWPLLREALKEMGRADLIGNGKQHLVPSFQPSSRPGGRSHKGVVGGPSSGRTKARP
ncbi:MAG: YgiQ family radical SAM protein [Betaproteobacteria bacterium]|nr:YgiQ family radical SAM protein [Betaproteobacteria bacterium]